MINWNDPEIDRRARALLAKMTLAEKIGQMSYLDCAKDRHEADIRAGRIGILANVHGAEETNRLQRLTMEEGRLGVPLLYANDIIQGYRTIFPIPLAQACSWDPTMVEENAALAAREAATGGTHWTFTPMVDVARDPRWGRIAEGAGEDTYLNCAMGRAQVRGFQRARPAGRPFLSCAKHYAAYGACEAGRDYDTVDISENTLRNVYLPSFRACVAAGVESIMTSFNEVLGRPAAASRFLLTDVLRGEWGFQGVIITDYNAVFEIITHGVAGSAEDACRQAIEAGVDVDMNANLFRDYLPGLVARGVISEERIDASARRLLYLKLWLGLFERPYVSPEDERTLVLSPELRRAARAAATKSMVLLKNDGGLLPLPPRPGRIAVIGPLADDADAPLGWWRSNGNPANTISLLAGLRARLGADSIIHAPGCAVTDGGDEGFAEAVVAARAADVVVLALGESARMSGEAHSRSDLGLPGRQEALARAVHATGKPIIVVLINGRPLATPWLQENMPAILEAWQPGTECGHAVADVLFGEAAPGGKLVVSVPRATGQVPIYYNRKTTGRPAIASGAAAYLSLPERPFYTDADVARHFDLPPTPLYPFGFGLSYTRFEYRDLRLSAAKIRRGKSVIVSAVVRNAGGRAGDEVVQLYVQDIVGSITRPVKELRGFRRVSLAAGEEARVEFALGPDELGFHDGAQKFVVEPGLFRVWIAPDSTGGLEAVFEVLA